VTTPTPPPPAPVRSVAWLAVFLWPLRWPAALLLLAANLTRLVPPDSRDAYQLVAIGVVLLLGLRIFFADHESREDRKAVAREARLLLTDQGIEALAKTLRGADAALAREVSILADRLTALDGPTGTIIQLQARLRAIEDRWMPPSPGVRP
jgi:hypothetical protein